jgi:glycosyltransferase involved in cell wall biosynthesis
MRVLHVNKFVYRRGGAESYMEDLADLQRGAGDVVEYFGMQHPQNQDCTYSAWFPPEVEFEPMPGGAAAKAHAFGRMIYSSSARRGMHAVIDRFEPDVVHLHNIYHQLSPSILRPLADRRLPVVMTLHDYKLACPTYQFLAQGEVCEACIGGGLRQAVLRRCRGGSRLASGAAAVELGLHRATNAYGPVGRFICPSRFMADRMAEAGVYPDRLRHVPHFIDPSGVPVKRAPGGDVLFAGRLSHEKGVDTLARATAHLDPGLRVALAGEGPELDAVQAAARGSEDRIRLLGRLPKHEVQALLADALALALPARWHENQPMIVLEAFAAGVPVVTTALGGLPELVQDGVTGLVVPPDDPDALAAALNRLHRDPQAAFAMGQAARARVLDEFTPARHLRSVRDVYREAGLAAGVEVG